MLLLPGMRSLAQRSSDEPKKVNFAVIVWAEEEKKTGQTARAFIPFPDIQVRLILSDGQSVSSVSSDQGLAVFKGLPADSEYMAEVSAEGYLTTVYHGRIPSKPRFPKEVNAIKYPSGSAKGLSPFKDAGRADIERDNSSGISDDGEDGRDTIYLFSLYGFTKRVQTVVHNTLGIRLLCNNDIKFDTYVRRCKK